MTTNGEFKIDKGVPLPAVSHERIYPFREMNVGDSFLVLRGTKAEASCRRLTSVYGKRLGRRYTMRTTDDGWRIWRVE